MAPAGGREINVSDDRVKQDLSKHRSPFSAKHKIARVLWGIVAGSLFRFSPRPLHIWRRMLLRLFRARIGPHVRIDSKCRIFAPWNLEIGEWVVIGPWTDLHSVGRIVIGPHCMVSQYCHLCAGSHDPSVASLSLLAQDVVIGDSCWICAGAFVGPGVTVGAGSVVGARSVALQDVDARVVVIGNPAKTVLPRRMPASDHRADTWRACLSSEGEQ